MTGPVTTEALVEALNAAIELQRCLAPLDQIHWSAEDPSVCLRLFRETETQAVIDLMKAVRGFEDTASLAPLLAARPAAPEAQGAWKPIAEAPKDGTEIWAWLSGSGVRKVRWWSAEELCEEEGRYTPDFYQAGFYEVADKTEWWNPAWWAPADRLPAPPASSGQEG